jgi:hypothetical protein
MINRPVGTVSDYVMDVTHDSQWRTGVVEAAFTSDMPIGVGTTGFDRIKANGQEMVATWTLSQFEAGVARWTLDSGPIRGTGGYICEQSGDDTRFTLEAKIKPAGKFRLLGPIFEAMARRQNRADVQKLKTILENPD